MLKKSRRRKEPDWVRNFEVSSHSRTAPTGGGDGGKGRTLYRITSVVYAAGFPEAATRITVSKTWAEVRRLRASLANTHRELHLKGSVPQLPRAQGGYFSRQTDAVDPEVVEKRRAAAMDLLRFAAGFPLLFNSQAFVDFFTASAAAAAAGDGSEDSEDSDAGDRPTSVSPEAAARVAELQAAGNVMDAAAEASRLSADRTPTLFPTLATAASSAASSQVPTPTNTSPDEEMKNLPDYLSRAAEDVSRAVSLELEENFDDSIDCYRRAIGTLLVSVQQDRCLKRQASVKRRIAQYIDKAEGLVQERDRRRCGGYLTPVSSSAKSSPARKGGKIPHLDFVGDPKDLRRYKVLGTVSEKVLLAKDFRSTEQVVIKTLQKSPAVFRARKKSLLPIGVPNMVKLLCYYETDDSLFLVLDYLPFGELYEVVGNVFAEAEDGGLGNCSDAKKDDDLSREMERTASPINPSRSVIKPSPSFVEIRNRVAGDKENEEEEEEADGSVEENLDFVHKVAGSDALLCFNKDGIENVDCREEEEDDAFDFVEDCVDEEGVDAAAAEDDDDAVKGKQMAMAAESLMSSINTKLVEGTDRATSLLDHLDSLESRIHSHLSATDRDPVTVPPSPFRRPESARRCSYARARTPNTPREEEEEADRPESDPLAPVRMLPPFQGYSFLPGEPLPLPVVRRWTSHLCSALFALHSRGVVVGDLHPKNLLLSSSGDLALTFQCEWVSVDRRAAPDRFAADCFYAAPETRGPAFSDPLPACDWWSAGVVAFELASGRFLADLHPSGLLSHVPVEFPPGFDPDLASLVSAFLRPSPEFRLQAREDIVSHPFFKGIDWPTAE